MLLWATTDIFVLGPTSGGLDWDSPAAPREMCTPRTAAPTDGGLLTHVCGAGRGGDLWLVAGAQGDPPTPTGQHQELLHGASSPLLLLT